MPGPLELSAQESSTIGMDLPRDGRYPSLGTVVLTNRAASSTVVLRSVRLLGSEHLSIHAAFVLSMSSDDGVFGGGFLVPPGKKGFPYPQQSRKWQSRTGLSGFELPAGARVNLLVVVDTDDPCGGSSTGLEIDYVASEVAHEATSPTGIDMSDDTASGCAR
jgi:hypothetical protein